MPDKPEVQNHTVRNGEINLALSSVGEGPDLLFVHGLGSAQLLWGPLVRSLSDRYRCWTLDLRGHGASDRAPGAYNQAGYGSDVAAALDHIGAPAIGIGHSLGGMSLARVAAGRHAHLRAIYLLDSGLFRPPGEGPTVGIIALFTKQLAMLREYQPKNRPIEDYLDVLAAAPYPAGGTNADVMVPEQLRGRAESLSRLDPDCIEATLAGYVGGDTVPPEIAIPMRMVAADPTLGAAFRPEQKEQLLAITPHATVTTMTGVGHQLMMVKGCDEDVRVDLEAWLEGHREEGTSAT